MENRAIKDSMVRKNGGKTVVIQWQVKTMVTQWQVKTLVKKAKTVNRISFMKL